MEVFTYFDLLKKNSLHRKLIKKIFFQELEQEKYHLRRRLQAAEEEYELRVNDLQADINSLRKSLEEASTSQRQSEKEKSLLITNLTEQNQRLTSQLKEVIYLSFLAFFGIFMDPVSDLRFIEDVSIVICKTIGETHVCTLKTSQAIEFLKFFVLRSCIVQKYLFYGLFLLSHSDPRCLKNGKMPLF